MKHIHYHRRPVAAFSGLVQEMLNDWPQLGRDFNNSTRRQQVPVNVQEIENAYFLELIAPGFDKADFQVNIENDLLTIAAEKAEGGQENGRKIRSEYAVRSFKRTFTVDEKIDATKIEASYVNGVLKLTLPKKEEAKVSAKQITIK